MQDHSTRPATALIDLFDAPVTGFEVAGSASVAWLLPSEASYVARAVDARRLAFAGGRHCARRALAELGAPDGPLLVGQHREPVWPAGWVGSISHTHGYCGAVAAPSSTYVGIGIDVEVRRRLERHLEPRICRPAELAWLHGLDEDERAEMGTVIFSAKEAFYKSQFCLTQGWLAFHDVQLEIEAGCFRVELCKPMPALAARANDLHGRFSFSADHVFAAVGIRGSS